MLCTGSAHTHHPASGSCGGGGGGLGGPSWRWDGKSLGGLVEVLPPDRRGGAIDLILKETEEPGRGGGGGEEETDRGKEVPQPVQ